MQMPENSLSRMTPMKTVDSRNSRNDPRLIASSLNNNYDIAPVRH